MDLLQSIWNLHSKNYPKIIEDCLFTYKIIVSQKYKKRCLHSFKNVFGLNERKPEIGI